MKSAPWIALSIALCAALAFSVTARVGAAEDGLWQTDFKAAQAKAKEEKKYLLVDFTGSDWCPPCMKLHKEVFEKGPFKAEAPKQFVLVELDFPRGKKQSEELEKQNKELAKKYTVEGFPTVLLLDAEGQVVARRVGYSDGGPQDYMKQLAELPAIYENVVASKTKLDKAKGLERAKFLDQIVDGYHKLGNESDEVADWGKEIIALDPDNKAGLKVKYQFAMSLSEARTLARSGKTAAAGQVMDAALALKGVPGEMRQDGYMIKVEAAFRAKNFVNVVSALKSAKEAAPESEMGKRIDPMIAQYSKVADAQAAAKKLEAGLESVSGMDRAKLLDKLIDAKQKLLQFDPSSHSEIAKWTQEIISLDADGKGGLKKKYQFRTALADVQELMQVGKFDEANAALDKALESAGKDGDEVQSGLVLRAQMAFMQHRNAEGVECLKKALAAAPASQDAASIKSMLARLDKSNKAGSSDTEEQ
jgi:protein disulfide-isomerase